MFRSEGNTPKANLFHVGVQHVSKLDILFLNRFHPSIPSIPIVVLNFTLNGKYAEPCDPHVFPAGAPFINYIRADDDYTTVVRRFSLITGDKEEAHLMRLAVLVHKVPHYVTRPRISDTITTPIVETAEEECDMIGPGLPPIAQVRVPASNVVWKLLVEKCYLQLNNKNSKKFPVVGIQRSVADVMSKNSRYDSFFLLIYINILFLILFMLLYYFFRSGRSMGGGSIKII